MTLAQTAPDAFITNHHVVIRQPADAIHPQMQRVDIHTVFQVKGELAAGQEQGATTGEGRMGGGGIGGLRVGVKGATIPGKGLMAARGLKSRPGGSKRISPRLALRVNAVASEVASAAFCGRSLL